MPERLKKHTGSWFKQGILLLPALLLSGISLFAQGERKFIRQGNREFEKALEAQQKKIEEINLDEVKYFREHFLDSYYLTLDEHTK